MAAVGDRHRRLHQIREVATAASDSRGSGSGRSIGSELADGGSGDDDGRRRQRDRHRPMQTVASDSRDSGSCVRLERRRRSVGRSDQSRQTAAVTVTTAVGDRSTQNDKDRHRRLRQTREPAVTAASNARGGGGGSGSDASSPRQADTERHRPTQTAASGSRGGGGGCVRLESQRRQSVDRIRVGRRRQWQ